ncbi:hypothetical protein GCM10009529_10440 [Micropruina glycogenica]
MGSESAGFEQAAGDVVGEVSEAEGGAAEVFESSVDGFGGAVGGAWMVEVGQYVAGASVQGGAEFAEFGQGGGNAAGDAFDDFVQ